MHKIYRINLIKSCSVVIGLREEQVRWLKLKMMSLSSNVYKVSSLQTGSPLSMAARQSTCQTAQMIALSGDPTQFCTKSELSSIVLGSAVNSPLKDQATEAYHNPAQSPYSRPAHRGIFFLVRGSWVWGGQEWWFGGNRIVPGLCSTCTLIFPTAHRPTRCSDRVLRSIQPQSTSAVSPPRKVDLLPTQDWKTVGQYTLRPIVTAACWKELYTELIWRHQEA